MSSPAIGAGLCLAAATDIRIAGKNAKMGWTFASLGIHPGMAATHFTAQLLGPQLAMRFLLTGEVSVVVVLVLVLVVVVVVVIVVLVVVVVVIVVLVLPANAA